MPKPVAKVLLIAGAALLLVTLAAANLTPTTTRAQADPDGLFRQFHDTLNGGDVTGALAFFTQDGVFETPARTFSGEALRNNFERQVSQNRQVDILSTQVSGNTLTASVEVRSNQITACGAERIVATETVTFNGDKISRLAQQDDLSDPQTAAVLACNQARGVPATGGEPPPVQRASLPLALLLGGFLILGGGFLTTLAFRRGS